MKNLIIYAHPDAGSFNHSIKETLVRKLEQNGDEVVVRDLYALGFDPVLTTADLLASRTGRMPEEIAVEQAYLAWAEVVTFVYPIWWTGLPAVMKGYIDRVFSYGFAYRYVEGVQEGLLKGKKAVIINTQGKSHAEYRAGGMDQALRLTSDRGIFEYCGFEIRHHLFLESVLRAGPEQKAQWLEDIRNL
ncbi:NAD(P)H-dependent oxidoreductase [Larkinella soli]|uniref:NAD(P)H-dependent oxidoreductase n=1 Tax=Larkinella soli TaxID=1770527 RepID=UPI000FFC3AC3|nr:NAD(P)H-dependent oxidoreductase [Larkinella soli]